MRDSKRMLISLSSLLFKCLFYLFIPLPPFFWLSRVLVEAHGISVEACRIFSSRRVVCLGFSLVAVLGFSLVVACGFQSTWAR